MTKMIHSYWAYIVLIILIFAIVNAIMGLNSKKEFTAKDLKISLFALIASHIQLVIGFIAAFISGLFACTWMIKIVKKGILHTLLLSKTLAHIADHDHRNSKRNVLQLITYSLFYSI